MLCFGIFLLVTFLIHFDNGLNAFDVPVQKRSAMTSKTSQKRDPDASVAALIAPLARDVIFHNAMKPLNSTCTPRLISALLNQLSLITAATCPSDLTADTA